MDSIGAIPIVPHRDEAVAFRRHEECVRILSVNRIDPFTLIFDPAGAFESLAEGASASVTFDYEIEDAFGLTSSATVMITITGMNDAPTAADIPLAATEDGPTVDGSFAGDDVDTDDDVTTLNFNITSSPSEGSVVNNNDGTFTFDPGDNFQNLGDGETRAVTFGYSATDTHGDVSNTGVVTVTVTGLDNGPVVTSVTPANGSHTASVDSDVVVTFDQDIDPATANDQSLVLHGGMSGALTSGITASGGTVTLDPSADFAPGELVQGSVTSGVTNEHGEVTTPHVWQFRAAVTAGSGQFSDTGQELQSSSYHYTVDVGDVDGDGDVDAFVGTGQGGRVFLNDGGSFTNTGQQLGSQTWALGAELGDLDGDGDLDAFTANAHTVYASGMINRVWLNDGAGNFSDSGQQLGANHSTDVSLGDVDGDGDLDAFVTNFVNQGNRVWLNDGNANFTDSGQSIGNSWSGSVELGDVDNDGDLDAFVTNVSSGGYNRVWFNDGAGTFSGGNIAPGSSGNATLGDVDGDGDLDAVLANFGANKVLVNDGSGSFSDTGQSLGTTRTQGVTLGDLDGDGDLDLYSAQLGESNDVFLNDGSGTFTHNGQTFLADGTEDIGLADFDGDGDLDAFVANTSGEANRVLLNNAPPVAEDDDVSTDEDSSLLINVLADNGNGPDSDAENDINPAATANLTSPARGTLTNNGDGTFTFDPNGQFDSLPDGATDSESFDYQIADNEFGTATATATITITGANDASIVAADSASVDVNEGDTATNTGVFSDIDLNDNVTLTASVGTIIDNGDGTWSWSFNTADGPDESQAVVITATDSVGSVHSTSFDLTVNNVAPSITPDYTSVSALEGFVAYETGTVSDPGADTVSLAASIGTVVNNGDGTWSWSFDTSDGPEESQTVIITAMDSDGATSSSWFDLTVVNVAPSVAADNGVVTVDEGVTASNTGTLSDPGADAVSLSASAGTAVDNGDGTWSWSFDTADGPDESQTIAITATDSDGADSTVTFDLTVKNVAPGVTPNDGTITVVAGETATNSGSFSDVGQDLVELLTSIGTVIDEGDGVWSWTLQTNADTPSQTVSITATDSDGASTSTTFELEVIPVGVHLQQRSIVVVGTDLEDRIGVSRHGDRIRVRANLGGEIVRNEYAADEVDSIEIHAFDGNDRVFVQRRLELPTDVRAGSGNDFVYTGAGRDSVDGGLGNDRIMTSDGDDTVTDLHGNNRVGAGRGDDVVTTGSGNDWIFSGAGNDQVDAGEGNNVIVDHSGNDEITTGNGDDWIIARAGDDRVDAGDGNNRVWAGRGNDTVTAGAGNDVINGGSGDDLLLAGDGQNRVNGSAGDDVIVGGSDEDWITGGRGRDILIGGDGSDSLRGGGSDDILIAGYTNFDTNQIALGMLQDEWSSDRSYEERIRNLSGNGTGPRLNGDNFLQTDTTVFNDDDVDKLYGASGRDWHLFNPEDDIAHMAVDELFGSEEWLMYGR